MIDEIPLPSIQYTKILNQPIENIIMAVLALVVGYLIVRIVTGKIEGFIVKNTSMPSILADQLIRAFRLFLYIIVILVSVSFVGINVNTIVISISAFLALILGFGMKDTVNNIASGVWIASMKVFDKGDEISVAGHEGTVMDMQIMATEIKKLDNSRVIIPNGTIWNNPIVNISKEPKRMIALTFGISYESSIDTAIRTAIGAAKSHPKVMTETEPFVRVRELAGSSIDLQLRAWTSTDDYYPVKSDLIKLLAEELPKAGVDIPYPHMDVQIREQN